MSAEVEIHKIYLKHDYCQDGKTDALAFLPKDKSLKAKALAVFTHGYSSHKGSILNWPIRLAEEGMPSVIFDLPGHYLGNFSEVSNFDSFKKSSPELFVAAHKALEELIGYSPPTVILGGHSLGAMLSLMALNCRPFSDLDTFNICVGLGQLPVGVKHLFQTPFYKSTLKIRTQLVSPELHPDKVFPWINEVKDSITISSRRVHFITGADDVVVGEGGTERMARALKEQGNQVSLDLPAKLPHHIPENAAGFIKKILKAEGLINA